MMPDVNDPYINQAMKVYNDIRIVRTFKTKLPLIMWAHALVMSLGMLKYIETSFSNKKLISVEEIKAPMDKDYNRNNGVYKEFVVQIQFCQINSI